MGEGNTPIEDLKLESREKGKDPRSRKLLIIVLILWLLTLMALVGVWARAYFDQKGDTLTLAQQVVLACESGDFSSDLSDEDQAALCGNAEKVIENQGEIQDEEIQESEIQEPEIQNPELQEAETQDSEKQNLEIQEPESEDSEVQDPEVNDPDVNDPETDDPEKQDEEIQNEEIQDDEIQDPEVDDPDPASPYSFTFTFVVPGNGGQPDSTYTVTCNSGTGVCTVAAS